MRTEVEALPWASFSARAGAAGIRHPPGRLGQRDRRGELLLVNILGTYDREKRTGATNPGRYSNPELDALTERAAATIDDETREAAAARGGEAGDARTWP